ncbi:hypothetical protein D3C81_530620 [compost metagenome]
MLVLRRPALFPGQLLIGQWAFDLGWRPHHQALRRTFEACLDEGSGRDNATWCYMGAIHHHGVHADQSVFAHATAVQHGAMADVPVTFHYGVAPRKTMHHAGVLQVGALLQHDAAEIAPERCQWADVAAGADDDVADQDCTGVHVGCRVNHGRQAVQSIARHGNTPEMILNISRSCIRSCLVVNRVSHVLS